MIDFMIIVNFYWRIVFLMAKLKKSNNLLFVLMEPLELLIKRTWNIFQAGYFKKVIFSKYLNFGIKYITFKRASENPFWNS